MSDYEEWDYDEYLEPTEEEIAERIKQRGEFIKTTKGMITEGQFKGLTWQIDQYENAFHYRQYIDFELNLIPNDKGSQPLIYLQ